LVWWYRAASVFAYPSLFEGFGLPVAEAMACGTPAITSNVSSLPEVAGDAALLVDPTSVEALAAALWQLLDDPALARQLREQGPARTARFTWPRTARETVQVYTAALNRSAASGLQPKPSREGNRS
jgi:glycosyltransferase involved in cell wall biosynthesis